MEKVFVYGTLKKGGRLNPYYMGKSTFIKEDTVKGNLYTLGSYPAITEGKNDVPGEIFEMPEEDFENVKLMEESAGYETKILKTKSNESVKVFVYMSKLDDRDLIDKWK